VSCDDYYASAEQYTQFWCLNEDCDGEASAAINTVLEIAASVINSAIAATGACSCTFASWVDKYLKMLNILVAASFHQCPCAKPRFSDDLRATYLEYANAQLELIRTGKIELCEGETGSEYPYCATAELGTTEFAQIQIILNDILRNS
jgi:hypothetical protein